MALAASHLYDHTISAVDLPFLNPAWDADRYASTRTCNILCSVIRDSSIFRSSIFLVVFFVSIEYSIINVFYYFSKFIVKDVAQKCVRNF